ncbi:hypothetical protein B0H67DRAFT_645999 [Lasiosphaeris hirsuta]|uniref:Uncharacterized protein n=1 Tax=Lasiosphaeris hirsuta TaxID=260670 RepID=A0AA40AIC2_9PEZI|nr:hypothetical protein B0H67DRAFT_645999 [Lasiosphaeris hirsuta]
MNKKKSSGARRSLSSTARAASSTAAASQVQLSGSMPLSDEFASLERIESHIGLMHRFKAVLHGAEDQSLSHNFSLMPASLRDTNAGRWLLEKWVLHLQDKAKWPLPPWDVAIIFYANLLSPSAFKTDITKYYPTLWTAGISFPLSRMQTTLNDAASVRAWANVYPGTPYQIIEFTPRGDQAFLIRNYVMDIPGYKCKSGLCKWRSGTIAIPMIRWVPFWAGRVPLTCISCGAAYNRSRSIHDSAGRRQMKTVFSLHLFDLCASPLRQFGPPAGFVERVLALADSSPYSASNVASTYIERYKCFLELLRDNPGTNSASDNDGSFWIRSTVPADCTGFAPPSNPGYDQTGIIRYDPVSTALPTSHRWFNLDLACSDEPYKVLQSVVPWMGWRRMATGKGR